MPTPYENEINARKTWELLQPELKYGGAVDPLPGMMEELAPLKAAKSLPFVIKVAQLLDSLKRNEPDFEQDYETGVVPGKIKKQRKWIKKFAKEDIAQKESDTLHQKINNRNTVFHGTNGPGYQSILNSDDIVPKKFSGEDPGVSVMRYVTGPKSNSPFMFELDRNKLPKTRPYAEGDYGKNSPYDEGMLKYFEAEDRTFNKPISVDAIKKLYIQKHNLQNYRPGIEDPPLTWAIPDFVTNRKIPVALSDKNYRYGIENKSRELTKEMLQQLYREANREANRSSTNELDKLLEILIKGR